MIIISSFVFILQGLAPYFTNIERRIIVSHLVAINDVIFTLQYTKRDVTDMSPLVPSMEHYALFQLDGDGN